MRGSYHSKGTSWTYKTSTGLSSSLSVTGFVEQSPPAHKVSADYSGAASWWGWWKKLFLRPIGSVLPLRFQLAASPLGTPWSLQGSTIYMAPCSFLWAPIGRDWATSWRGLCFIYLIACKFIDLSNLDKWMHAFKVHGVIYTSLFYLMKCFQIS